MRSSEDIILDTFLFSNSEIVLKAFHVERTHDAYLFLNSSVDVKTIAEIYAQIEKKLTAEHSTKKIVRVLFPSENASAFKIEILDYLSLEEPILLSAVHSEEQIHKRHEYKFADRSRWERFAADISGKNREILLVKNGKALETARFNLFLHDSINGVVLTPTLQSGCLNGVLRRSLLKAGHIQLPGGQRLPLLERDFSLSEMADSKNRLFVGNSVRGLLSAVVN